MMYIKKIISCVLLTTLLCSCAVTQTGNIRNSLPTRSEQSSVSNDSSDSLSNSNYSQTEQASSVVNNFPATSLIDTSSVQNHSVTSNENGSLNQPNSSDNNPSSSQSSIISRETSSNMNSSKITSTNTSTNTSSDNDTNLIKNRYTKEINLNRGINFSGFENSFSASMNGAYITQKSTYENVAQKGFDHIRLPVDFRNFANSDGTLKDNMSKVDTALELAYEQGLSVMLDFHGWPNFSFANGDTTLFVNIWKNIAQRYKDHPDNLIFELINEPHTTEGGDLNMTNLTFVQCAAADEIRKISPERIICFATVNWNSAWSLLDWQDDQPPFIKTKMANYDNIIVALHNYHPLDFTHQNMAWAGTSGKKYTYAEIESQMPFLWSEFEKASEFTKKTGIKVVYNEIGLNTDLSSVSEADQVAWVSEVMKAFKAYNLPCTWWEYNSGFGLYKSGNVFSKSEWKDYIVDIILE